MSNVTTRYYSYTTCTDQATILLTYDSAILFGERHIEMYQNVDFIEL